MTTPDPGGRIALLGLFGVGNIGNEASLASALRAVEAAGHDAVVLCEVPEVVSAQHGVRAERIGMSGRVPSFGRLPRPARIALRPFVEVARWVTAFRFVRTVEGVVVPGTGILDDFGMSPWQMPWDLYRWAVVSRLARRPFSMLSIGAGPIEHPTSRRLARGTVRRAVRCTYRDEGSRSFMTHLGVPSPPDTVVPDLVFTLPRPPAARPAGARTCVGIGVMAYYGWRNSPEEGAETFQAYMSSMVDIAGRVLDRGFDVRVLVGEGTDDHAVRELIAGLHGHSGGERVTVGEIDSIESLLGEIAGADAVVATRFHNVVGALMMHRPTVSIGYAEKNRELMESAGLGAYCHHVDRIDVDGVVADLVEQLAAGERIENDLEAWDDRTVARVARQYDEVFDRVSPGRSASSVGR